MSKPNRSIHNEPDPEEKAREEVERLQAGPLLDARIAEEIMGWSRFGDRLRPPFFVEADVVPVPTFSTEMRYAWAVVMKLRERGINLWALGETAQKGSPWQADFGRNHESDRFSFANTPELAICRAALLWAPELAGAR